MTRSEKIGSTAHQKSKDVSNAGRSELEDTGASSTKQQLSPSSTSGNSFDNMGMMAQRLGSERSWAESFVPSTPTGTVMTPTESSVAGDEQDQLLPSNIQQQQNYPDEPPPSYSAYEMPASISREPEDPLISVPTSTFIPSRKIVQHETTSSITGTYSVYDVLDLSTVTGAITITLEGRPGSQPALIKLSSKTGSINVKYASAWMRYDNKTAGVLDREFHTTITTKTGSINANSLLLGNGGSVMIESTTGSVKADIYLTGSAMENKKITSRLDTRSKMGTQHIEVKTVSGVSDRATLLALRAEHRSLATASVNVKYPRAWEGVVHASCGGTGSVNVKGDGLEYQNQGSRDIFAWRGEVQSNNPTVEVRSDGTGSVTFKC